MKYAILANPGHNRVYFEESKKLSLVELELALKFLNKEFSDIKIEEISNISYITFETEEFSDKELKTISSLSFSFALFEMKKPHDRICLIPVALPNYAYIDPSISNILKYSGKTNELFTRLMINVGRFSLKNDAKLKILDPMAGKGTTLYEGLVLGNDVCGIEVYEKSMNEGLTFFKKFLETLKYKHQISTETIHQKDKKTAKKTTIKLGRDKDDFKNSQKTYEIVSGTAEFADTYFKKKSFDLVVADLPYGIQHGSVKSGVKGSLTRNPKELIASCVSPLKNVLKDGGAVVFAWNSLVLSRESFGEILSKEGYEVLCDEPMTNLVHRVDNSIRRDLIVAIKK